MLNIKKYFIINRPTDFQNPKSLKVLTILLFPLKFRYANNARADCFCSQPSLLLRLTRGITIRLNFIAIGFVFFFA